MPGPCEDCGSGTLVPIRVAGVRVLECDLCGALDGDAAAIARVGMHREAVERGLDPRLYPLLRELEALPGLVVHDHSVGDPQARIWPYVMLREAGPAARTSLENLLRSLMFGNRASEIHWVLELELVQTQTTVVTLKPRFHRRVDEIDATVIERAQADLERLGRELGKHSRLSWWVAAPPGRAGEPGPA